MAACALAMGAGAADVGLAGGHGHAAATAEAEFHVPTNAKIRGIELGEFRIRAHYPVDAQKSVVRFVLYAEVASESSLDARRLAESRQHKLRDQIITVTRMVPLSVYDDADLANFRRRILLRLRRALPELPIEAVYVSDFQLTVKSL